MKNSTNPVLYLIPAAAFLIGLFAFTLSSTGIEGTWNLDSIAVETKMGNEKPTQMAQSLHCTVQFNGNHTVDSNCDDAQYKGTKWRIESSNLILQGAEGQKPWTSKIKQLDRHTLVLVTEIKSEELTTVGTAYFSR